MKENQMAPDGRTLIDVPYVARLARLALTPAETRLFQQQLEQVVGYMRDLAELDVTGVDAMANTQTLRNVLRPDVPRPGLARETVLANAPRHDNEQFIVPKII